MRNKPKRTHKSIALYSAMLFLISTEYLDMRKIENVVRKKMNLKKCENESMTIKLLNKN